MNRRFFLKLAGSAIAAATAPLPMKAIWPAAQMKYPNFNPKAVCGNYVTVTDMIDYDLLEECKNILSEQIVKTVPKQYRHKIKPIFHPYGSGGTVDPLYQCATVGWKYTP